MVSYFENYWPRLQLDVSITLYKSALRVNTCTQPVTMKDVDLNSSAHWRRFPAFPGTFSVPHGPRKTVVRKTEGYSLSFSSFAHKLVVPNCLTLVGVLTFHYGNYIYIFLFFFMDLSKYRFSCVTNNQPVCSTLFSLSPLGVCACTANSVLPSCAQIVSPLK